DGIYGFTQDAFCVVLHRPGIVIYFGKAVSIHDVPEAALTDVVRGDLRAKIALTFSGSAHIGKDRCEEVGIQYAPVHEPHRREDQALLINLLREWHRAGTHSTYVGVVGTIRNEEG